MDKTVVTVFNKIDRLEGKGTELLPRDFSSDYQVRISAKTGDGLKDPEQILGGIIRSSRVYLEKVYPTAVRERFRPYAPTDSFCPRSIRSRALQ